MGPYNVEARGSELRAHRGTDGTRRGLHSLEESVVVIPSIIRFIENRLHRGMLILGYHSIRFHVQSVGSYRVLYGSAAFHTEGFEKIPSIE